MVCPPWTPHVHPFLSRAVVSDFEEEEAGSCIAKAATYGKDEVACFPSTHTYMHIHIYVVVY